MKIFISWSGERSRKIAESLRDWMPLVLHYAKPWLSESDIEAGARWGDAVAKELEASNFGIICVTRDNVDQPWVLFEAGALAKSLQDAKVIPLLLDLDLSDLTGPLAQFQAKKVDKAGLHEVVRSINQSATDAIPPERMDQLFEALWAQLEAQIESVPDAESSKHRRPQTDVLEELVAGVRGLDVRLRESLDSGPDFIARRRRRRMHPMMFEEMAHMMGEPGDPIVLLMAASVVREEVPWLYELAVDAYRAAQDGSPEEASRAMRRFSRAIEMFERGPFVEMGIDPREMHMIFREVRHLLELRLPEEPESAPRPRPKRQPTRRAQGKTPDSG